LSGQIAIRLEKFAKVDLGSFSVDRFFLKKSTLTREGPIYEDLA
jgi:2'-5' RNA ligase